MTVEQAEDRTNVQDAGSSPNYDSQSADGNLDEEARKIIDGATMLTAPCKVHIHQERLNSMVTWVARCLQTIESALMGQQELLGQHGKRLETLELSKTIAAPMVLGGGVDFAAQHGGPSDQRVVSQAGGGVDFAAQHGGPSDQRVVSQADVSTVASTPHIFDRGERLDSALHPRLGSAVPEETLRATAVSSTASADLRSRTQSKTVAAGAGQPEGNSLPSGDRRSTSKASDPGASDARYTKQSVENSLLPMDEQRLPDSEALPLSGRQDTLIKDLEGISEDQHIDITNDSVWPLASTSPFGSGERTPFESPFGSRCPSRLQSRGSIASQGKLARKFLDHQETLRRVEDQVRGDVQTLSEVVQGLQHDLGLRIDELFDKLRSTAKQSIAEATRLDSEQSSGAMGQADIQREASENLCISGLPRQIGDEDLKDMFEELDCDVVDHRIIADPRSTSTSVAMVQLTSKEQASKAMDALNGKLSPAGDGSTLQVEDHSILPSQLPESEEALSELLSPKLLSPKEGGSSFLLSPTGAQSSLLSPRGAYSSLLSSRDAHSTGFSRSGTRSDTTQLPIDPTLLPADVSIDGENVAGASLMHVTLDESVFVSKPNLESALNDIRGDMADQLKRLREKFESVQQNIEAKLGCSRSAYSASQVRSPQGAGLAAFVFSPLPGYNCAACGAPVCEEQMRWTSQTARATHSLFPARSPRTSPKKRSGKSAESIMYDKLQQQIALEQARRAQYLPGLTDFRKKQSPKSASSKREKNPKRDNLRNTRSLPALTSTNKVPGIVTLGLDLHSEKPSIFKPNARAVTASGRAALLS